MKLILASASPRRAELLQQLGLSFVINAVGIDESPMVDETPETYVKRLALEKARAVKQHYLEDDVLVLGSDTAVIVDGHILGKPDDDQHALQMLKELSGKIHQVLTSVALIGQQESYVLSKNAVSFKELNDDELAWYLATGESKDKAGAYAIQGKAALFIRRIEGSFSGVMGLPLYETGQLLKQQGVDCLSV
tara:strand:- start:6903 stop:7478 length:576 start_codon:yes stop_codon:yes gene_type:complete